MNRVESERAPTLVRELGLLDATMIVVGTMIGSGVFITSAESSRLVGSPGWLMAAWALAGLLTITNTRGLKTGKWIQNTFTFTKTAALVGLIVVGLGFGVSRESAAWTSSWWNPSANGWTPHEAQADLTVVGSLALVMLLGKA